MCVRRKSFWFFHATRDDIFHVNAQRLFDSTVVLGNRLHRLSRCRHAIFGDAELGELSWIHHIPLSFLFCFY